MTWQEVIEHKSLQDLPFKIELNKDGVIEMSPATNWHGFMQGEILSLLNAQLGTGRAMVEASIQTTDGVRVADVVWANTTFLRLNRTQTPFLTAPEICIEIVSPSNSKKEISQKIKLYLEAGASEVWTCTLDGELRFYNQLGQLEQSQLAPEFPQLIEI